MKAFFFPLSLFTHIFTILFVCGYKCHPAAGQDDIFTHKYILALQLLIKCITFKHRDGLKKKSQHYFSCVLLHASLFVCYLYIGLILQIYKNHFE